MLAPEMSGCVMDETRERRWNFWHWLGLAVLVYFLPFIAMVLDGVLFQGRLHLSLPDRAQDVYVIMYRPLFMLGQYFGWFE
jgi:hypothetical protein